MAAFMGTFSGTLNAAQSYLVNDIYLKYFKPKASISNIMMTNYLIGGAIVIISIIIGIYGGNINDLLQWIVGGLYGGYVAANVLEMALVEI
jgi:SSS family solute:Na+ symporter